MIQDLVVLLLDFLIMLCVYGLGQVRQRHREPKPPPLPNLNCGCGHGLSFHDGLNACHFVMEKYVYNKKSGNATKDKKTGQYRKDKVPCFCQQYTGELPADWYMRNGLPEIPVWAPPVGRPRMDTGMGSGRPADMPSRGTSDISGQEKAS